ncbi:MAG: hypothetical protein J6M30_08440 [Bacteroidales bacterium]|nr:hypothetical protein [Bacteroidales bacterium]
MKVKNIIGTAVRILIGLVFVASAVTKYISIDAVDLFVYEHQLFSWNVTTFVTRLLIAAEGCLGIMLLAGIYPKTVKRLSIIMLAGFTVYVLLKPVLFNVDSENCHCFGTVLLLSDRQTLIKNIILLTLSYFMFWDNGWQGRFGRFIYSQRKYLTAVIIAVCLIVVNTVMMPEPIERNLFPKKASVDQDKFEFLMQMDSVQNLEATKGKKILCLYSTGCKYCKQSAIRLDVLRQKYDIPDSNFALVFWGSQNGMDSFFVKTNTKPLPHTMVHPIPFLQATKGRQPVVILFNEGKIEKLLKYPNINEKDIKKFLNK